MIRVKIGDLIKIKERPETTLLLKTAIHIFSQNPSMITSLEF
jgi:hypothetical protein